MEKICASCGNKSHEDTTFCTKCGTPYPTPEEEQQKIANEHLAKQPPQATAGKGPMQKIQGIATGSLVWGWIILFFSFCFGFWGLMNANFSGPASEITLSNINSSIAFFGVTFLWALLGATLIIFGGIMSVVLSNIGRSAEAAKQK